MARNTIDILSNAAIAVAVAGVLVSAANAQQVYRAVGPDGKVTFSDQPPPSTANTKTISSSGSAGIKSNPAGGALPYELRQIASKYPVTLYTSESCAPCAAARSLLTARGVPFSEKTITTAEDSKALQRLSGDTSLPFATIGGQQLNGFSDVEWTQYLNAAGYPASSLLPANYRQAAATPLVAMTAAPAAAPTAANAVPPTRPAAPIAELPANPVNNPAGIKF